MQDYSPYTPDAIPLVSPPCGVSTEFGLPCRIDKYTLLRKVGAGGMGTVYEASQDGLNRHVAIKILADNERDSTRRQERFLREANAASRLAHSNIAQVFDFGVTNDGVHWLAMTYVDGDCFHANLDRYPATWHEFAGMGAQVASALACAHTAGVVHRDVKPANLMLDQSNKIWITDFGIAAEITAPSDITQTGEVVGTPRYMSPEQMRGIADARSDVFGLGVSLYQIAVWRQAFLTGEAAPELSVLDLADISSLVPDMPKRLANVIMRACEWNPKERFASAEELKSALEQSVGSHDRERPSLLRLGASLIAFCILVLGTGAWLAASHADQLPPKDNVTITRHESSTFVVTHTEIDLWPNRDGSLRVVDTSELDLNGRFRYISRTLGPPRPTFVSKISMSDNVLGNYSLVQHETMEPGLGQIEVIDGTVRLTWWFDALNETRTFTLGYEFSDSIRRHTDFAEFEKIIVGDQWKIRHEKVITQIHPVNEAKETPFRVWARGVACEASLAENGIVRLISPGVPARQELRIRVSFPSELLTHADSTSTTLEEARRSDEAEAKSIEGDDSALPWRLIYDGIPTTIHEVAGDSAQARRTKVDGESVNERRKERSL